MMLLRAMSMTLLLSLCAPFLAAPAQAYAGGLCDPHLGTLDWVWDCVPAADGRVAVASAPCEPNIYTTPNWIWDCIPAMA